IAAADAVALTRPGLYVLVRTGNPVYDVNDSIESTLQPPQASNDDIYVGRALAARLRTLATQYAPRGAVTNVPVARAAAPAQDPHGALTLAVAPTETSDVVVVSGSGPANVPVSITLSADISRDIPRI